MGPTYIGPFMIIAWVGKVTYRLDLPDKLSQIHNTFYVSQLRKCLADESAVVALDDIQVDERLKYIEGPITINNKKTKTLHKGSGSSEGETVTPEGFQVDLGIRGRDEGALP